MELLAEYVMTTLCAGKWVVHGNNLPVERPFRLLALARDFDFILAGILLKGEMTQHPGARKPTLGCVHPDLARTPQALQSE